MSEPTSIVSSASAENASVRNFFEQTLAIRIAAAVGGLLLAAVLGASLSSIALGLLILIGGTLLGVIALFWASLRTLAGETVVDESVADVDLAEEDRARTSRKKMLLRALKDLEREHSLGKMTDDDFADVALRYREEIKSIMRELDDDLAERRVKAEALVRDYATTTSTGGAAASGEPAARVVCGACNASNERDAKFCKECAKPLHAGGEGDE